jgi:hypothetical protein
LPRVSSGGAASCNAVQHVASQCSTLQRSTACLAWCSADHGLRELWRARRRGGRVRLRLLHAALWLGLRVGHLRERCVRLSPSSCSAHNLLAAQRTTAQPQGLMAPSRAAPSLRRRYLGVGLVSQSCQRPCTIGARAVRQWRCGAYSITDNLGEPSLK